MNAILYTRVSTDEQANKGYSLPNQEAILKSYCNFNKIDILKHFQEDFSAKNFDRPEFNKLLQFVKANKRDIDVLLFTRWDRFSRNQEEALRVIREFRYMGLSVNAVEQPLDLSQTDCKLMLAVYLAIPEVENDKNSERTKAGMRRGMREGYFMGIAPIGYKNARNEEDKSTLKPDEKLAPLVRSAFNDFITGLYSAEELRKIYLKKGLKLSKQGMLNMLRNPTYCGKILVKEWKKEPEEIVNGCHPRLISDEVFEKAQARFGKKKSTNNSVNDNDEIMPLRGHIYCPICKGNYTGAGARSRNKKLHYYYHCAKRCIKKIRADESNVKFVNLISQLTLKDEVYNLYLATLKDLFKENGMDSTTKIKSIQKDIEKNQERIANLGKYLADGVLDANDYKAQSGFLKKEIMELENHKQGIKTLNKDIKEYLKFGVSLLNGLDKFYTNGNARVKKMIVGSIFPEKLEFDGKIYRTTRVNEIIGLMFHNINDLEALQKKKATKNSGLSKMAPPSGLEPETL